MSKIRAVLVDDEQAARNVLKSLLSRVSSNVEIVGEASDLKSAVKLIKEHQPDLVFLDIQMPNFAGYEIVKFFDRIDFEIVFVTAYDDFAIKAFELSAVDYLVKPIHRERLASALQKVVNKLREKTAMENYEILLQSIEEKVHQKIIIPELGQKRVIDLDNIIAFEGKGAYSSIYIKDQKDLFVSKNLKYFESLLPRKSSFFRTHKSWIINTKYITGYTRSQGEIQLNNELLSKISKYRVSDFELEFPLFV